MCRLRTVLELRKDKRYGSDEGLVPVVTESRPSVAIGGVTGNPKVRRREVR